MPPARRSGTYVSRRAVLAWAAASGVALCLGSVTSTNARSAEGARQVADGVGGTVAEIRRPAAGTAQIAAPGDRWEEPYRIRVFTRTLEYRHDSIPDAVAALRALGAEHGFDADQTEDPAEFADERLPSYHAVVFLMTTGDVLDGSQQAAVQRYIQRGGGFVGIHSASDTEHDWQWYGRLVGAYFKQHPDIQTATVLVEDGSHPSTTGLPERWERTDEWYDFRTDVRANPGADVHVLLRLDESTYRGGGMGADHPIAWYHEFDGGRAWYTGGGHTAESYREPLFLQHVLGGIQYAAGAAPAS